MVKKKAIVDNFAKRLPYSSCQHFTNMFQGPQNPTVARDFQDTYWHNMCNKLIGAIPRFAPPVEPESPSKKLTRLRRNLMRQRKEPERPYPNKERVMHTVNYTNYGSNLHRPELMLPHNYNIYEAPPIEKKEKKPTSSVKANKSDDLGIYRPFNFGVCSNSFIDFCEDIKADPTTLAAPYFSNNTTTTNRTSPRIQERKTMSKVPPNPQLSSDFTPVSILKKRQEAGHDPTSKKYESKSSFLSSSAGIPDYLISNCSSIKSSSYTGGNLPKKLPSFSRKPEVITIGENRFEEVKKKPVMKKVDEKIVPPKTSQSKKKLYLDQEVTRRSENPPIRKTISVSSKITKKPSQVRQVINEEQEGEEEDEEEDSDNNCKSTKSKSSMCNRNFSEKYKPEKGAKECLSARKYIDDKEEVRKLYASLIGDGKTPSSKTSKHHRKVNLSQMFKDNKLKDIKSNKLWESVMELVVHMFDKEKKAEEIKRLTQPHKNRESRSEGDKNYAIYLVVTSEDESDQSSGNEQETSKVRFDEKDQYSEENIELEEPNNLRNFTTQENHINYRSEDDFTNICNNHYQSEHYGMPKRFARSRAKSVVSQPPGSNWQIQPISLKLRPPLHWPKTDYSKTKNKCTRSKSSVSEQRTGLIKREIIKREEFTRARSKPKPVKKKKPQNQNFELPPIDWTYQYWDNSKMAMSNFYNNLFGQQMPLHFSRNNCY